MNWKDKGVITSVKNQGLCGSCWAFSAAANAESVLVMNKWAIAEVDLSEQYLVECTRDSDCEGTYYVEHAMDEALKGLPAEAQFPYDPFNTHEGICSTEERVHIADANSFFYDQTDAEVIELLQSGPLVVSVSAVGWPVYERGVFECRRDAPINHAVQLVGYDEESYLLKNQWGEEWGEGGYIRVTRDPLHNCQVGKEVFDFEKTFCRLAGCSECAHNSTACFACHDPLAQLIDQQCVCPNVSQVFDREGICVDCRVRGCVSCRKDDPDQCGVCSNWTVLRDDDHCSCEEGLVMNMEGACEACDVLGCAACQAGDPSVCARCKDCSAFLEKGVCVCNAGYAMNGEGQCQFCPILGC